MSVDLADRYGKRRPISRLQIGVLTVLGAVLLGWLIWAATPFFTPQVSSQEQGWKVIDEHSVEFRVAVDIRDGAEDVSCRVKVLADDKNTVGELPFVPVDGTNTVTITTERQGSAVEWVGCTAKNQSRPQ